MDVLSELFAPDGIHLSPYPALSRGPAGARAWLVRDTLNSRSTARWTVVHHGVAADGRDAFTYGYFDVIRPSGDTLPGKFHAYWRRSAAGEWQLLAFVRGRRSPGPMTREFPAGLVQPASRVGAASVSDTAALLRAVFQTEAAFADSAAVSVAAAFTGFAAPDAGKLESGSTYAFGPSAIAVFFANAPPGSLGPVWKPEHGSVATSGDLAFTFGPAWPRQAGTTQVQPPTSGRYFTIWKRQPNGTWRYVVD